MTRDGEPVTTLKPYLGSFGHLVMLRASDLAYLHAHPDAETPSAEDRSGPTVTFHATAASAGRYLLYFDFLVDGSVHSASFVLDATAPRASDTHDTNEHDTEEGGEHEH